MTLPALLDTNIVSAIMRDDPRVSAHASVYLAEHEKLVFSLITRYEIMRGLLIRNLARRQMIFDRLCNERHTIALTQEVIDQAAVIYANLSTRGLLIDDADILIAATALVHNWRLITDNERHLRRIPGLTVENWTR